MATDFSSQTRVIISQVPASKLPGVVVRDFGGNKKPLYISPETGRAFSSLREFRAASPQNVRYVPVDLPELNSIPLPYQSRGTISGMPLPSRQSVVNLPSTSKVINTGAKALAATSRSLSQPLPTNKSEFVEQLKANPFSLGARGAYGIVEQGFVEPVLYQFSDLGKTLTPAYKDLVKTTALPFEDLYSLSRSRRLSEGKISKAAGDVSGAVLGAAVSGAPYILLPGLSGIAETSIGLKQGDAKRAGTGAAIAASGGLLRFGRAGGIAAGALGTTLVGTSAVELTKVQVEQEQSLAENLAARDSFVAEIKSETNPTRRAELQTALRDTESNIVRARDNIQNLKDARVAAIVGTIGGAFGTGAAFGASAVNIRNSARQARELGVSRDTINALKKATPGSQEYAELRVKALNEVKANDGLLFLDKKSFSKLNKEFPRTDKIPNVNLQKELVQRAANLEQYGKYLTTTEEAGVGIGARITDASTIAGFVSKDSIFGSSLAQPNKIIESTVSTGKLLAPRRDITGRAFTDVGIRPIEVPFRRIGASLKTNYGSVDVVNTFRGPLSARRGEVTQVIKIPKKGGYVLIEDFKSGRASRKKITNTGLDSAPIIERSNVVLRDKVSVGKVSKPNLIQVGFDSQGRPIFQRDYLVEIAKAPSKKVRGDIVEFYKNIQERAPSKKRLARLFNKSAKNEKIIVSERYIEKSPGEFVKIETAEINPGVSEFSGVIGEAQKITRVFKSKGEALVPTPSIRPGPGGKVRPSKTEVVYDFNTGEVRFNSPKDPRSNIIPSDQIIETGEAVTLQQLQAPVPRTPIVRSAPRYSLVPRTRAPRITTGEPGPQSEFAGQGTYEVSAIGLRPVSRSSIARESTLQPLVVGSASRSSEQQRVTPLVLLGLPQLTATRQIQTPASTLGSSGTVRELSRLSTPQFLIPRTSQIPAPNLRTPTALVPRQTTRRTPGPSRPSTPVRPGKPFEITDEDYDKKKKKKKKILPQEVFIAEIRRSGKFRPLARTSSLQQASAISQAAAERTLAASLRIREARTGRLVRPIVQSPFFRPSKSSALVLVQQRGRRLSAGTERREIQRARRSNGNIFFR